MKRFSSVGLLLVLLWVGLQAETLPAQTPDEYRPARPLENAENALDLVYLPDRVVGSWEDRWTKLDVYQPKGLKPGERRACILFVHGGGYSGGDKNQRFAKDAIERAVDQGFVAANLNYILGKHIFPQVFYDFNTAVRFLRANAEKYYIDPNRIGAWGFSAGGWLSSSSSFTTAGDIFMDGRKVAVSESWAEDDPRRVVSRFLNQPMKDGSVVLAVPMDDARPLYGEFSSRIQALQADFAQFESNITPAAPAICTYIGRNGISKLEEPARDAGVDFLPLVLEHPKKKFGGLRAVHVPPLEMLVPSADGKSEIELQDRVLEWFKQVLVTDPVTPVPEFRPNRRWFADTQTIQLIVPDETITVHYTTDGSIPTQNSPVWTQSLTISNTTVLKAIARHPEMKPSRVATARFTKGEVPPTIVRDTPLPPATIGKPYEVKFQIEESEQVIWKLVGHYRPENSLRYKGNFGTFTGVHFDPKTGTLSGVPTRVGAYTLQLQAAWKPGHPADTWTQVLHIQPADQP